ncbi:UNVERIFIED_CONTAM: hypothetical protein NCL1_33583 [Trichonephila clavipes]
MFFLFFAEGEKNLYEDGDIKAIRGQLKSALNVFINKILRHETCKNILFKIGQKLNDNACQYSVEELKF